MNKHITHALAALALGVSSLGFAQQFNDVPANHWAKTGVEAIAKCGLIEGFPDGSFRGPESVTRYQAALIFYRYLQNPDACNLSGEEQAAVDGNVDELRAEIAAVSDAQMDMIGNQEKLEARIAALEARGQSTSTDTVDLSGFEARVAKLEARVDEVGYSSDAGSALEARITVLERRFKELDFTITRVTNLEIEFITIKKQIEALSNR